MRCQAKWPNLRSGESSPIKPAVFNSRDFLLKQWESCAQHQAMRAHSALTHRLKHEAGGSSHRTYPDVHVQEFCFVAHSVHLLQSDVIHAIAVGFCHLH